MSLRILLWLMCALLMSCKTARTVTASDVASNMPESDATSYVIASYDQGGALNETILNIIKAIPPAVTVIYLTNDDAPTQANVIGTKIPKRILTHENSDTQSSLGTWEAPWTRDFSPEFVRLDDGGIRLVHFRYFRPNSEEVGKYLTTKFTGISEIVDVPYYIEGGNLVVDADRNLFISERALINNLYMGKPSTPKNQALMTLVSKIFESTPWEIGPETREIKQLRKDMTSALISSLNLKTLTWLPALNYEKGAISQSTGHLDIFMKYLGANRMLVGEITVPTGLSQESRNRLFAQKGQLDDVAKILKARGYTIIRMPFSVNVSFKRPALYSYTNALILGSTAIVPKYAAENLAGNSSVSEEGPEAVAERAILVAGDAVAMSLYQSLGFTVKQVDAATAWNYGGQIHCLTKHVPQLEGVRFKR